MDMYPARESGVDLLRGILRHLTTFSLLEILRKITVSRNGVRRARAVRTCTTLSPANARATRSRCSNAFTPLAFALPFRFALNSASLSCSSSSLFPSESLSFPPVWCSLVCC